MHRTLSGRGTSFLTLFLFCLIPARTVATELPDPEFIRYEGLLYSLVDVELRMDLFLPQNPPGPVPCIIVIQGGGFMARDGKKFHNFAKYLAEHGMAAATIAYRGQPDHTYRKTIADVKAAVRYVRSVSGKYGINPNRIGSMGRSAGATLAVLLAVTGGLKEFEGTGGHAVYSSRIQAAVGYAGVYDFIARFADERQVAMQPNWEGKVRSNGHWIGAPFALTNEHWLNASAVNHIDAADPPVLLMHCRDDPIVPWLQSERMYEKLQNAGVHAELEYYEAGGHGFGIPDRNKHLERMADFFKRVLVE